MDLVNHTPYPAFLWTAIADDQRLMASLVARVTFDVREDRLIPSADQLWPVSPAPWKCPYGPVEADAVFYKGGVDFFVFGHARAPAGREATQLDVSVQLGDFRRRVVVFGDRTWERGPNGPRPGQPQRFREIGLGIENAFGGKADWDGLNVPFADNPSGKGYYLEEEQCLGQPLPNLEDPEHPIRSWDDRPDPVGLGFCPMANGKRLRHGIEFDEDGVLRKIHPRLFNAAFPEMVVGAVNPGDRCLLEGVSEAGLLRFRIPDFLPRIRLTFDNEVTVDSLTIDQVGVEVDERRTFISYRYPFGYVLYPMQRRLVELFLP